MWHLTQIPQIAHYYWRRAPLTYQRLLTIKNIKQQKPAWQVHVHSPVVNSHAPSTWSNHIVKDYREQLNTIDVIATQHDFDSYGFSNQAHEVHKSDFLRWRLLAEQGGLWSDIDILYVQPMNNLIENTVENSKIDTALCPLKPPGKHTVGFILGSKHNAFYKYISELAVDNYNATTYQCMGSDLINNRFDSFESFGQQFPQHQFIFLNKKGVYSITSKTIEQFYQPVTAGAQKKLASSRIIGYHWFGGHPASQAFENTLTETNVQEYNNFLAQVLKEQL